MRKIFFTLFFILLGFVCSSVLTAIFFYQLDDLPLYQNKKPKAWMLKQIRQDLENIKFKESYPEFDALVKKHRLAVGKVIIKNEKVSYKLWSSSDDIMGTMNKANHKRFIIHIEKIRNLIKKGAKIKDTVFYLYSWDAPNWYVRDGVKLVDVIQSVKDVPPIFVNAVSRKDKEKYHFINMPDDFVFANRKFGYWVGWNHLSKKILNYNKNSIWHKKQNAAVWVGKASNPERTNVVEISENNIKYVYAKDSSHIKKVPQILKSIYAIMAMEFSLGGFMSKKEQINYKMLINIDGLTCTFPGLLWRLLSNSVTLKQETEDIQWFYPALKPWVHYIPLKRDMSDLVEKVKWVLANDGKAKKIAEQSTKFVKENLMMEDIDTYMVTLLNEYSKLRDSQIKDSSKNF